MSPNGRIPIMLGNLSGVTYAETMGSMRPSLRWRLRTTKMTDGGILIYTLLLHRIPRSTNSINLWRSSTGSGLVLVLTEPDMQIGSPIPLVMLLSLHPYTSQK